jgi:hypothetical protein
MGSRVMARRQPVNRQDGEPLQNTDRTLDTHAFSQCFIHRMWYLRVGTFRAQCVEDADSACSRLGDPSFDTRLPEFEFQLSREIARRKRAVLMLYGR